MPLRAPTSSWPGRSCSPVIRRRACLETRRGPRTRSTTATGSSSITASGSSGTCSRRGGLPAMRTTATGACSCFGTGCATTRRGGRSAFSWNDHSTAIRTWVLACAAVVAPKAAWVRDALRTHGAVLADPAFYVDHGNHALNQSRGLLAAGCILGRRDWQRLAARRIAATARRERRRAGRDQRAIDLLPALQPRGLPRGGRAPSGVRHGGSPGVPAPRPDDRSVDARDAARRHLRDARGHCSRPSPSRFPERPLRTLPAKGAKGPMPTAAIRDVRRRVRVRPDGVGDHAAIRGRDHVVGTVRARACVPRPS